MGLTLVTGRANAGKTGILLEPIRTCVRLGGRGLLLLPSQPDVQRAKAELARECPIGLRIQQFDHHLDGLWRLHGDGRRIVGDAQRLAVVRRAAEDACFQALAGSAGTPGFLPALASLVKRAAGSGSLSKLPPAEGGPAGELARFVAAYGERLSRSGLVEAGEAFAVIAGAGAAIDADVVSVNRFMDLSESQRSFIRTAAEHVEVLVALTWEEGFAPTSAADGLVASLLALADVHVHLPDVGSGDDELDRLGADLFGEPASSTPTGALRLSCAAGETAEAERIASEVVALLGEGLEPGRIVVAYRDPQRHRSALARAFADSSVPAAFDVLVPFRDTGIGRALLPLLAFALRGSRDDLLSFLRSPFSGASLDAADGLEAGWRRRRVQRPRRLVAELEERVPDAAALVREAERLAAGTLAEDTARRWRCVLAALLRNGLGGEAPLHGEDAVREGAAHRECMRVLGDMASLSDESFTGRDVERELLEALVAPASVESIDHVQVTSVERLRGRRFDAVVIGGLTASEFPRAEGEGLLSADVVTDALGLLGLFARPRQDAAFERLLFYLAVTRARRRLVLSRQDADADGREMRPSVFWDEVLDVYRGREGEGVAPLPPVTRLAVHEQAGESAASLTPRRQRQQEVLGRTEERARRSEHLFDTRVREALAERRVFSASELESYVTCPYLWFHRYVVSAEGLDAEIGAREAGTLAHRVLQRVYRELPDRLGVRRISPDMLGQALELAEAVHAEEAVRLPEPDTLEEAEAVRSVRREVRALLGRDAAFLPGFEPAALEWRFGLDEADPPEDLGGFLLRGTVDRIDVHGGRAVVMDYKRTEAASRSMIAERGLVQLPLYAAVVERRLGVRVVGVLYRSLRERTDRGAYLDGAVPEDRLVSTDRVDDAGLRDLMESAFVSAREAADGIRTGRIGPRPRTVRSCERCGARHVCGGGS